jgi:hypothetical protein
LQIGGGEGKVSARRDALGSDLDVGTDGDLVVDATGDLAIIEGTACLRANLLDRLLTARGELVLHPEFGGDLEGKVSLPEATDRINRIRDEVRYQLLAEPRVKAVEVGEVVQAGRLFRIPVRVTAIDGQVVGNLVFPLEMEGL